MSIRDNYKTTRFDKFRFIPKELPLVQQTGGNLDHRMHFTTIVWRHLDYGTHF